MANRFLDFCRVRLGLKPVFDYIQTRQRLLGIADLDIRTVIDIGANKGKKLRLYRRTFPHAKLYGIEPLPWCYARLKPWADKQAGMAEIINVALSSAPTRTTIYQHRQNTGWSTLRCPDDDQLNHYTPVIVQVETLDRLASQLKIEHPLLVKIDVEGLDLEVIKGGLQTLNHAAALIVEIAVPEHPSSPEFCEFVNVLRDLGLQYRGNLGCAVKEGIIAQVDAVFIRPGVARRQAA